MITCGGFGDNTITKVLLMLKMVEFDECTMFRRTPFIFFNKCVAVIAYRERTLKYNIEIRNKEYLNIGEFDISTITGGLQMLKRWI